jgi:hypothetical protein
MCNPGFRQLANRIALPSIVIQPWRPDMLRAALTFPYIEYKSHFVSKFANRASGASRPQHAETTHAQMALGGTQPEVPDGIGLDIVK